MKADLDYPEERDPFATSASDRSAQRRWQRITEIVGAAWEMDASKREAYLVEQCQDDDAMRSDVERLLRELGDSSALLQSGGAAAYLQSPEIRRGTLLGRYRVEQKIGEGGMGVVYRATDESLQRVVALKVLRFRLIDPAYRRNLLREARMAAALNHPNIVAVYDIGSSEETDFIAMEYVSGTPLDQIVARGPLMIPTAVGYAQQIAGALAKAHTAGIVHRDLKPGNVIIAEDGSVKILDFGLAKRLDNPENPEMPAGGPIGADPAAGDLNRSVQGTVFGTVAYMSPEQARGGVLNERSDIFTFGAILYELVSGRRAFRGGSQANILNEIRSGRVPSLRDAVPKASPKLCRLVAECMRDAPERRPKATEIVSLLQALGSKRKTQVWTVVAAFLMVLAAAFMLIFRQSSQVADAQLSIQPLTFDPGDEISPSFSPDGSQAVFSWRRENENTFSLYRMPVSGGATERLTSGAFNDFSPVWSADGQEIAFVRSLSGQMSSIQLISLTGGAPRKLTDLAGTPWSLSRDLDWSPDSKSLVYADADRSINGWSIFAITVKTGEKHKLAQPRSGGDYVRPVLSPDGEKLAFTDDRDGITQLRLLRLKRGLIPDGVSWPVRLRGFQSAICNDAMWLDSGRRLLFQSNKNGASLQIWRVDIQGSEANELVPAMVGSLGEGALSPTISRPANYLAFARLSQDKNIWRVSLSGKEKGQQKRLIGSTRQENFPEYSPDGSRIAFESDRSGFPEIWISNSDGTGAFPLTNFGGPVTGSPAWSPDGLRIAFDSRASGRAEIFVTNAAAGSKARPLTTGGADNILPVWSADGRFVYYASKRAGIHQGWRVSAEGGEPEQITSTSTFAQRISPDDKYLYFMQDPPDAGIYQFDLATKKQIRIVAAASERSFTVTKRGVYYLFSLDPYNEFLRIWDARTHRDSSLVLIQGRRAGGLSVSQDDSAALVVKDDRGGPDLMLVKDFK